jgi:formate transporter
VSYLVPSELLGKMLAAGQAKVALSTRDTLIRAFMGGALLALGAVFAVTAAQQTGYPIIGAILFPVGFCTLYLLGYDLLTGVFVLSPLALIDKRHGVTPSGVLRNWGLVFAGNFLGALTVAVMMAIVFTFCFSEAPSPVGKVIATIGEARTLGYKSHGAAGMLTLFIRGVLCNWMVSTGVVGAMVSTTVGGKVLAMWMPITLFFGMAFEHSVVNMFLFPSALLMGGNFSVMDYIVWNELPTVVGNMVGGILFTGLTLYSTHVKTAPRRFSLEAAGEPALDSSDIAGLEAQATNQSGWTALPSDRPVSRAR